MIILTDNATKIINLENIQLFNETFLNKDIDNENLYIFTKNDVDILNSYNFKNKKYCCILISEEEALTIGQKITCVISCLKKYNISEIRDMFSIKEHIPIIKSFNETFINFLENYKEYIKPLKYDYYFSDRSTAGMSTLLTYLDFNDSVYMFNAFIDENHNIVMNIIESDKIYVDEFIKHSNLKITLYNGPHNFNYGDMNNLYKVESIYSDMSIKDEIEELKELLHNNNINGKYNNDNDNNNRK